MEKRLLKTALFGYSKTDVCEYIADVNAEFSKKLLTLSEEQKTEKAALTQKIATLEAELAEYKKVHTDISTALLEAQQYSLSLRKKAEEEDGRIREENAKKHQAETLRLNRYIYAINELREKLASLAALAETQFAAMEKEGEALKESYIEEVI